MVIFPWFCQRLPEGIGIGCSPHNLVNFSHGRGSFAIPCPSRGTAALLRRSESPHRNETSDDSCHINRIIIVGHYQLFFLFKTYNCRERDMDRISDTCMNPISLYLSLSLSPSLLQEINVMPCDACIIAMSNSYQIIKSSFFMANIL